jgi:hypothetical protein
MRSALQNTLELTRSIDLVPYLGATVPTAVFISIAVRQNEKKEFIDRDRPSASGTIKLGGFEVSKVFRLVIPITNG